MNFNFSNFLKIVMFQFSLLYGAVNVFFSLGIGSVSSSEDKELVLKILILRVLTFHKTCNCFGKFYRFGGEIW